MSNVKPDTRKRGTDRLLTEWRNRVRAEYGSAGLAAQVVHWMIQCGFPEELVAVGLRIVQDELDHARLSHDVVVDQGGEDEPMSLDIRATAAPTASFSATAFPPASPPDPLGGSVRCV